MEGGASAMMAVVGGGRSAVPAIPETARARPRPRRRRGSPASPEPGVCGIWSAERGRIKLRLVLYAMILMVRIIIRLIVSTLFFITALGATE